MTLGFFIIFVAGVASLAYFTIGVAAVWSNQRVVSSGAERSAASIVIILLLGLAIAARPSQFGVDTITYYRLYDQYCFSNFIDLEFSYDVTFGLLNVAQAGACSSAALTATWIGVILLAFLLLPEKLDVRLKLGALTIFSMIGVELSTNALRQGISVAALLVGFAWYRRNRAIGVAIGCLALALHSSSGLVLIALIIAHLRLSYFLAAFSILVAVVLSYSYLGLTIGLLDQLTGLISKYSLLDPDDLYIRALAAAQLFATVVLSRSWKRTAQGEPGERMDASIAIKLSLTTLPYLTLPYFGYRYVYGVYLIVLYLCRSEILDNRRMTFELLLIANIVIALGWALGSTYLRNIPFVII